MVEKRLSEQEETVPAKMSAKTYDINHRLVKTYTGLFASNHFIWKDGGIPILRALPLLKSFDWVKKREHQIACDFEQVYDDVNTYVALYTRKGDHFEQIKIKDDSKDAEKSKNQVNLEKILLTLELADARIDSGIPSPVNFVQLATILMAIFAVMILIGFFYAGQSALGPLSKSLNAVNVSVNHLNSNFSSLRNLSSNLTAAYRNNTKINSEILKALQPAT